MNWLTESNQQHKQAVATSFSRAAARYDDFALLQQRCGHALLTSYPFSRAGILLDAGSGSGWYSRLFMQQGYQVIALDLAAGMLQHAQASLSATWYLQADFDKLPLAVASLDCIWSNLALQWSAAPEQALAQLLRALKPNGQLRFSTLSAGSLFELSNAWQVLDNAPPVHQYPDFATVQQQCQQLGVSVSPLSLTCHFPTVQAALWSLKGVGASTLGRRSSCNYLNRQRLAQLAAAWPRDRQGYRLTYQIVLGKNSQ